MKIIILSIGVLLLAISAATARDIFGVVAEGDSLTYTSGGWFYKAGEVPHENVSSSGAVLRSSFRAAYPATGQVWANYSLFGSRIADLESRAAVLDALINPGYLPGDGRPVRHYILCLLVGTNQTDVTPTVAAARVRTYCLARQAAGWKVLIGTIPSRTDGGPSFDTGYAQPQNAIFRTWGAADGVAGIIDFAADPEIGATGAANSTTYFADRVHPTEAGAAVMAARARLAITGLINSLDTEAPTDGTMTLSSSSPVDAGAMLAVTFSNWKDQNTPLTYGLVMNGTIISAQDASVLRSICCPVTPGTHALKGRIYDPAGNVTEVTQSFRVNTARESWRKPYFGTISNSGIAADSADPNKNGIPNLIEYALNGDPTGNMAGTSILPQALSKSADRLKLTFRRHQDRNDITLIVQGSDTLDGTWTDLAQSVNGAAFTALAPGVTVMENGTGNKREVTVGDSYQINDPAHPRRFMRLKVISP